MKDIRVLYEAREGNKINIIAESTKESCRCPKCGVMSSAKHSKYTRKLTCGSLDDTIKEIIIIVKKFKCKVKNCSQRIFVERLSFALPYSRITNKIIDFIKTIALSTSAEKASIILSKIGIKISHDTIIRLIRNLSYNDVCSINEVLNIGLDNFAFKKRKSYCTVICDMDKRKILDILPSRNKDKVSEWLNRYHNAKLVSRDGSISYAAAISEALPNAKQISDKFHLIKSLLDCINKYIRRKYPKNLAILKSDEIIEDNNVNVSESKLSSKNLLKKEKVKAKWLLMKEIKEQHTQGISIHKLASEYSMSRNTIRKYLAAEEPIYWSSRITDGSKLDCFKNLIIELLLKGNSHEEILSILNSKGYRGSKCYLSAYMSKNNITKKKLGNITNSANSKAAESIPINKVIKTICKNTNNLNNDDKKVLNKLKENFPDLMALRDLIDEFKAIFSLKESRLQVWITKAKSFDIAEINSYIKGIENDINSIENSIISDYNNGLLEGIVNKIKGIKRLGNGRSNFDLLRARILHSQEIFG